MKKLRICKIFLLATLPLCAWDSDREKDEDRRNSQFENTREIEGGYDWSKCDRHGNDDHNRSCDESRCGTIPSHDDSKD